MLAADGGIFFDAAVPGEAGDGVCKGDPECLDDEAADEVGSGGFAHVNADGKKELIREGGVEKDLFEPFRQNIEWKEMAAGDVFEGEKDEDESGNFEDPKRKHGHGVGGEELEHGGHYHGDEETAEGGPVWRQDEIFAQTKDEQRERNSGDSDVSDAAGKEEAKAINEVIDWFEEELADIAVFDVGRDLPIIFVHGGQRVDDGDEQIIGNHLGERVSADVGIGPFAGVNGAPDINDGDERDETEEGSGEEIEAVREIVLNADVQDVPVLFHDW
jgi:hypothetical protein